MIRNRRLVTAKICPNFEIVYPRGGIENTINRDRDRDRDRDHDRDRQAAKESFCNHFKLARSELDQTDTARRRSNRVHTYKRKNHTANREEATG
jgi:hypothetical protein